MFKQKTFNELEIGMKDSISKVISQDVIQGFANVSEDTNPLHFDQEFAKTTVFGKCVAHGMISAALISAVLGTKMPGIGSVYLKQELIFKAPVYIDDVLTAYAEIIELDKEKKRVKLATWCETQVGKKVVDGCATMMFNH